MGRERSRAELHTELHLALGADGLEPGDSNSVSAAHRLDSAAGEIAVPGGRLRLHPLARTILAALGAGILSLEALRAKLAGEKPDAIRAAVLELAEHDVVTIVRAAR